MTVAAPTRPVHHKTRPKATHVAPLASAPADAGSAAARPVSKPAAAASPEEAQSGGTMAPDEDALPDAPVAGAQAAPDDGAPRPPASAAAIAARTPAAGRAPQPPHRRAPRRRRPAAEAPGEARSLSSRSAMERYPAILEHEELLVRRGARSGEYCIVAVHSTVRGPALGGCRMWSYDDSRAAVATRCACRAR